ncbi:HipA N-terminal domain-containing protein [Thauera sp.]|uniref:HipA N-terminal domain-containing protein n=1 Tax=Thauera sp. TaxID=1905334 RepID=UPI002BFBE3C5|nr:HipA N-terminal domain-containing protein [Thauera sp.]HRO35974.1 HipA N-terminal domain-containing protein [Thauera sp.]
MTHELEVWLFSDRVGTLALVDGRLGFCYTAGWLSRPNAVALSHSLPLRTEPFDDRTTRPFFAGLLPEGQMRRLIARQFQVSGQNDFALLDRIGGECAGAVTFLAPGQSLPTPEQTGGVLWLRDEDVVAVLDELPRRPMLAGKDGLRLSLAGAQDKLPVVFDGTRLGLPLNGTPSSHILKPPIDAVEDSVVNEGFCMALAEALQLKPAMASVHAVLNRPFLLVERYDRVLDAQGCRQRLHQEDFCQALGVVPEMKYQNEGRPDLVKGPARRRMLELANSLPRAARALQSDRTHGFAGNGVVERIVALIEQRCALTLRKLSAPLSAPTSRDGDSSASPQ